MMDAGPELDAEVALKVMGWAKRTIESNDEQVAIVPPGWTDLSGRRWWGHRLDELVPPYSTSIAAAWLIVEHLRLQRFYLYLNDTMGQYRCVFYTVENTLNLRFFDAPIEPPWAFADTAPHAVSLAALAAVGAESR